MKRREFSLASLSTAAALGGLSLNNTAFAQGPAKFVEARITPSWTAPCPPKLKPAKLK